MTPVDSICDRDLEQTINEMEALKPVNELSNVSQCLAPQSNDCQKQNVWETHASSTAEDELERIFEAVEKRRREMPDELKSIVQSELTQRDEKKKFGATSSDLVELELEKLMKEIEEKEGVLIDQAVQEPANHSMSSSYRITKSEPKSNQMDEEELHNEVAMDLPQLQRTIRRT